MPCGQADRSCSAAVGFMARSRRCFGPSTRFHTRRATMFSSHSGSSTRAEPYSVLINAAWHCLGPILKGAPPQEPLTVRPLPTSCAQYDALSHTPLGRSRKATCTSVRNVPYTRMPATVKMAASVLTLTLRSRALRKLNRQPSHPRKSARPPWASVRCGSCLAPVHVGDGVGSGGVGSGGGGIGGGGSCGGGSGGGGVFGGGQHIFQPGRVKLLSERQMMFLSTATTPSGPSRPQNICAPM
eukprot:scaffold959_cov119-Isochrysis_galbana.AAC.5